jgi:hypothetical protein
MTNSPLHPDVIEYLDDESLIEAYQNTGGEAGDPIAGLLSAEIERRNLNL